MTLSFTHNPFAYGIIMRMRYFGTDGIRNTASYLLENDLPFLLGKALSRCGGKIVVARDVREHSLEIEKQLCKGLLEGACQIWLTGVMPTPALAYTAQTQKASFAVMITASHNPPEYNGLKVFGKNGQKLSLSQEKKLDDMIFELADGGRDDFFFADELVCADALSEEEKNCNLTISLHPQNHRIRIVEGALFAYLTHVKKLFTRFDGMKVRLDCANGCFAGVAPDAFASLGVIVNAENNTQNGKTVNVNCGSTHIEKFAKRVQKDEIGFAFDGDGDRVLAVVDQKVYDGDAILLALSTLYRIQGKLKNKFVVGTTLTNTRLQRELAFHNTALLRTQVGDKYILDALQSQNCLLGGEKSGHIIMLDKANTGDGLITALSLLEVKKTIGSLPKFIPYPMLQFNVPSSSATEEITTDEFQQKIESAQQIVKNKGRLIIRPSGTEPYIRVCFECFDQQPKQLFEQIKAIFTGNKSQ